MLSSKLLCRLRLPYFIRMEICNLSTTKDCNKDYSVNQAEPFHCSSNDSINKFLIDTTLNNRVTAPITSFTTLINQLQSNVNIQLPYVLPHDTIKRMTSALRTDLSRSVVTIAHILPLKNQVTFASGFGILNGQLIVTCAHPFYQAALHISSEGSDEKSQTIVITQDGELIRIVEVASHLVDSDLVIVRLENGRYIDALAVDPHPAPISTSLLSYDFLQLRFPSISRPCISHVWKSAEVLYYKDRCGQEAATGTYDELTSMIYSHSPSNGSSGGPIISADSSCVVAIIRGNEINYGNNKLTGFAVPGERLFEAFKLPGIPDEMQ